LGQAWATAARLDCGPAGMPPARGPSRACCTARIRVAQSSWGADRQLRARSTSPESPARRPQRSSCPTSGWSPSEGEADTALRRCQAPPPCRVGPRKRHQFVVTLSPLGHRPGRASEPTRAHRLRDGRDTVMVGLARWAHDREDLAATCVRGQRQAPVRCGPGRFPHWRTRWMEAAPHLEGQPSHGRQGREGAIVVRSGPQGLTAAGTLAHNGRQRLRQGWGRAGCRTSQ
jgi:hypothetical protein